VEWVKDYAIFMLDPEGIITSWNAGAQRAKGYSAAEIIGKPLATLYTPEDAAVGKPQQLMKKAVAEGSAEAEGWRIRKDGSRFWANVILTALWDHGELRGFAKVTRDMTERKRADETARSLEIERIARKEAERANQLKMRFLALVSHELRTPLTSIKGFTSTLLANDVSWTAEQKKQFLEVIDSESDRLQALIEQLLDLSQMQAGALQLTKIAQSFSPCLDLVQQQLAGILANREFDIHMPDDLPNVMIDESRIVQVLSNIIENAVKFAPQGTRITLTAAVVDGMVEIDIHDEGPGIPKDRRESIFEAFNQMEKKPHQSLGVGIGLAVCKGIVEAHGGDVWIKDDPSPGATITFTLPMAEVVVLDNDRTFR
jgi:PAS domain S-box-containing protein